MNKEHVKEIYDSLKFHYYDIVYAIVPFIMYASYKAISSYKLYKTIKPDSNKKVLDAPVIESLIDKIEYKENTLKDYVNNFIHVVTENFDDSNLTLLKNNLQTLRIIPASFLSKTTIQGYESFHNVILFKEEENLNAIYHELFHLSSSLSLGDKSYSGFYEYSKSDSFEIGYGLNEGYTQLLTTRYFKDVPKAYVFEMNIAYLLEKLTGTDNLANMYFNANLKSLITFLTKYASYEEVMLFITSLDFIVECETNKKTKRIISRKKVLESISYVIDFLVKVFAVELNEYLSNEDVNNEFIANKINDFCTYIPFDVNVKGITYRIYDPVKISDMIVSHLKNKNCKLVISEDSSRTN